jgi:Fe-S oxidoreductase
VQRLWSLSQNNARHVPDLHRDRGGDYVDAGRANAIRAVLQHRVSDGTDPLRNPELDAALSNCLACKACTVECPSNVNMSLLKTELLHARIRRDGVSLRQRLFSSVDLLGRVGCMFPGLSNFVLQSLLVRTVLYKLLQLAWQRPFPRYASKRFDRWFLKNSKTPKVHHRGRVILWDDTFVRYHEPHIGMAAVKVLQAAGFQVELVRGRKCCGRPAFSQGYLEEAARLGRHNIKLFNSARDSAPILFLEPSCYSMFVEDYRELKLSGTEHVAKRCFLFEQFMDNFLSHEPDALKFKPRAGHVVIHAHCHLRALHSPAFLTSLAQRLPRRTVSLLDTGCCGMAGAFGALESKYELSLKVAEPLAQKVRSQPFGTVVVASGTSCRHQIAHLAPVRPRHMAELLADALVESAA